MEESFILLEIILPNGNGVISSWLDELKDKVIKGRILSYISRLRLGSMSNAKPEGSGIIELRLFFGSGYRVYFTKISENMILLLAIGDKSSQDKDIIRAKKYLFNYQLKYETKKF